MTNAHRFQNALRIMLSLDEVATVLDRPATAEFHRDPFRTAVRMDEPTWAKVFALIEARQPAAFRHKDGTERHVPADQVERFFDNRNPNDWTRDEIV